MRRTLGTAQSEQADETDESSGAAFELSRSRTTEPDGPYRPDIGLRNGILISIALWIALISAMLIF